MVRHPALAVPHLSLAHIGHLDFEGLRAIGCKGIVFDKVSEQHPSACTAQKISFQTSPQCPHHLVSRGGFHEGRRLVVRLAAIIDCCDLALSAYVVWPCATAVAVCDSRGCAIAEGSQYSVGERLAKLVCVSVSFFWVEDGLLVTLGQAGMIRW